MSKQSNLPWKRGDTFYNGSTIDSNDLGGANYEGKEYIIEDNLAGTGKFTVLRVLRNAATIALSPGRICSFKAPSATVNGFCQVDGYAKLDYAGPVIAIDNFNGLPSTIPVGDLFYGVVQGPTILKTSLGGDASNLINAYDRLVALTAAASTSTTAGRIQPQSISANTTTNISNGSQIQNCIGYALSAVTTSQTDASILVDIRRIV